MIEDISAFYNIALHNSLTKAGKELGISTSVVTRRLARLEKLLNTSLVRRTTRKIYLTEAGELFFQRAGEILENLKNSQEEIKNLNEEVSGILKVALPPSISYLYVTKMLHKFTKKYPKLKLQIVTGNNLLHLLANGFDLVIHAGKLPDSSFHFKKIAGWGKIFCASKDYLKKHGTPKKPEDLKFHNCIDRTDNVHKNWEYQENNRTKKIIISGNICVDNNFDGRNLALSGIGIACLSKCAIYEDLKSKKLISILKNFQPAEFEIYAVYQNDKFMAKKIKVFIDFLSDLLKSVSNQTKY
jgi:DNA-binding transcriptional LysR family regulator